MTLVDSPSSELSVMSASEKSGVSAGRRQTAELLGHPGSVPRVEYVPASHLPVPPQDEELWWYFGRQNREVQAAMTVAFVIASISMIQFIQNSVWLLPFFILLAVNVAASLLSLVSGFNKRVLNRTDHEAIVAGWRESPPATYPSVDVYLPCCGEDLDVLRNTYHFTSLMTWPGELTVWVLDDGDQPQVRELAAEFGFEYIVRPNRGQMKKAGNLRHAFRVTKADFIVILDADFCPRADFLDHTIPYMDDPSVGIVQTPQFFETSRAMNWLERTAGATQELFYRWVQPSRDRAGAAVCVGSCALYRRTALAYAGGFAQIEHSEDVHTGIQLLRDKSLTKYVPILVSKGLCPDELGGFLNQQYRWCNGSMTLFRSGKAQTKPLTVWQTACFWAGFAYYISTAFNVVLLHLPVFLVVALFPEDVRASYVLYFLPGLFIYFVMMPRASKSRWRVEVLRVQMAYSLAHAVAIWHKIFGRTAGWVATGAVGKKNGLARSIATLGIVVVFVNLVLPGLAVARDVYEFGWKEFWPTSIFLALYAYVAVPLGWGFFRVIFPRKESQFKILTKRSQRFPITSGQIGWFRVTLTTATILAIGVLASGLCDSVVLW